MVLCFPGVDADADPQLANGAPGFGGKPFLDLQGAGYRLASLEGRRDPVASVLGDPAPAALDLFLEDLVVAGDDGCHHASVLFPQPCRTLNVGEEKHEHVDTPFWPNGAVSDGWIVPLVKGSPIAGC